MNESGHLGRRAEGRSHATVFQVQADPDLLGSVRSARQDFSLRFD